MTDADVTGVGAYRKILPGIGQGLGVGDELGDRVRRRSPGDRNNSGVSGVGIKPTGSVGSHRRSGQNHVVIDGGATGSKLDVQGVSALILDLEIGSIEVCANGVAGSGLHSV